MSNYVRFFREMTKTNFQEAGGKAANLGKLSRYGLNVPDGFYVTSDSFSYIVTQNQIQNRIDAIVLSFDYGNLADLGEKCAQIRELILQTDIPGDLSEEISNAIKKLNDPEPPFVAVRSSVAVKNTDISSFPGMMDTYHYLKGEEVITDHIRKCWASLWTRRAVVSRYRKNIDHHDGLISPIVQKMVHSDVAGVMFTANPITNNRNEIVIEANWGLGESVVSGKSMNDFYLLGKSPLLLKDRRISKKNIIVCFDNKKGYGRKEVEVPYEKIYAPTLSDDQVKALGEMGINIEKAFGFPQDIEWAYEKGELYILQTRNIRTLKA